MEEELQHDMEVGKWTYLWLGAWLKWLGWLQRAAVLSGGR